MRDLVEQLEEYIEAHQKHLKKLKGHLVESNQLRIYSKDYLEGVRLRCTEVAEELSRLKKELFTACLKKGVHSEYIR